MVFLATRARAAMYKDNGKALRRTAFLHIEFMFATHGDAVGLVGLNFGKQWVHRLIRRQYNQRGTGSQQHRSIRPRGQAKSRSSRRNGRAWTSVSSAP